MGDGLFLISLLSGGGVWVFLSIRAQARGALCCQPATVHQDDVKTGPPHPRRESRETMGWLEILFLLQWHWSVVCISHCPDPARIAVASQNVHTIALHILESTAPEATTKGPRAGGSSWIAPPCWSNQQNGKIGREPDRRFAGEEREETHFGVHSVPKYWSLGPLGNGWVGPHLPLLGPLVPLGAVIIAPMRHLPRHQASDRSSGRYCHPHFTD